MAIQQSTLVIALYAFNTRRTLVWPIPGLTLKWFGKAIDNPGVRDALVEADAEEPVRVGVHLVA